MSRRPGFTLVEVVLSMAVLSIVLAGVVGALALSTKSIATAAGNGPQSAEPRDAALEQLHRDLSQALALSRAESSAIEFTVPDRDQDGDEEVLLYEWADSKDAPLMFSMNGGSGVAVADRVSEFSLEYATRDEEVLVAGTPVESAETTLFYSQQGLLDAKDCQLTSTRWIGQQICPVLPPDATSWRITRVRFQGKRSGLLITGTTYAQVRTLAATETPTSTVLEQVSVAESSLGLVYGWYTVTYSTLSGLSPDSCVCFVLKNPNNDNSADIRYADSNVTAPGGHLELTSSRDTGWAASGDGAIDIEVFGKYTRPSGPTVGSRTRLISVGARLTLAEVPGSGSVQVGLANMPEVNP